MSLKYYKAASERTDEDERALIPAFERTQPERTIDQKRVEIQLSRIDACDILLDYVHDDVPHAEQQPITDQLNVLRGRLTDEMQDALTP